ncbi:aspartyl protease family protein [Desertivirga arenae]|uniref:aspartyl protease family protein n=1 Tax=Desertivirga arenae TaxID=2810309 RepID=UPI001A97927D|nr:PDZ domain-containing protein [Pedobacter sp. SYSU D00823]
MRELKRYLSKATHILNLASTKRLLLSALFTLLILQSGSAQFKLEKLSNTEAFEFRFIKNLIIIPLLINNKGPFNFVLDTGVGVFLITDPGLVDSLQLPKSLRKIKVVGFGEGKELEAAVTGNLDVAVNAVITGNLPAAILKEDAFDLSSYTGIPIHGLIGYEFFNSFTVRLNYMDKIIKVYRPEARYFLRRAEAIPITIEAGKPYINAEVALNKTLSWVKLIIDTGAGHPLWLESIAGKRVEVPQKNIRANLGVGLSGTIDGSMGRLSLLKLGKFELKEVVAAFPDYEDVGSKVFAERNGNMGNAVLKKFEVIFDYQRSLLFLRPNYDFKKPFEHDMSGIELIYHSPDYSRLFIGRVEPGSAADLIGLEVNDEIVDINFRRAKDWNIDEIYQLFRSRPDKGILLTIIPKGEKKTQVVVLTLKRRI